MRLILVLCGLVNFLGAAEPAFARGGGGGGGGGHGGGGYGGGGHYGGYGGRFYGYGGYGFGFGLGFGLGYGYFGYPGYGYGYYGYPGYGYYGYPGYGYGSAYPIPEAPTLVPGDPNSPDVPATGREKGMKITNLSADGPAAKALLRNGDIILGVGNTRVQSLQELRSALAPLKGDAEIVFINSENGKVEKLSVKLADGKIGATVEEFDLSQLPPPKAMPPE
jgi:hypothetical protein